MAQISENSNSSNKNINSYDQMIKIIVNLGSKGKQTPRYANWPVHRIRYSGVFLEVSKKLLNNEFCGQVSWHIEVFFFPYYLS